MVFPSHSSIHAIGHTIGKAQGQAHNKPASNKASLGGLKRYIRHHLKQAKPSIFQRKGENQNHKLETINRSLNKLSVIPKPGEKGRLLTAFTKQKALTAVSWAEFLKEEEELNRKAIEIFGPKSWKAVLDSTQAEDIKAQVQAFIKKREAVLERTENIQFKDTPLKKFLDKLSLDSFQQMREMKRSLYNLRRLLNKVRKVDKEGQQLAYRIHAITEQERIRSAPDLSDMHTGGISPHSFEPAEILFLLKHDLKRSLNPKDQELFDKLSIHGESILENKQTQNEQAHNKQALIEIFKPDEVLRLKRKKMIVQKEDTGEWVLNYPKTRRSAIIKDRTLLEASNYKPLMDDLEVYQSLQKKYSIAGSTNLADITKRLKKGLQTPRAILNLVGSITKSSAKTGGVVEATTFAHPILGPISLALGAVNILGNALNTVSDLIQLKQSQGKQKVAKAFYKEYKNNPDYKELAAVAKRLKNHHNYRDDIISAFVHSNKTVLAVAGVVTGAVIFGLSIAGSAASMGIASPILGAIGGASLSLTVGLISYKLSLWANREIRSSRWKKPHQQLEQIKACKQELTALRSNPTKKLDPAIYKNDLKYKAILEKSEAYQHYMNAPRHKARIASNLASGALTANEAEALIAKEALIFARIQRLEAALPQGAWFDKMIGGLQRLPLMGRAVKITWGGPHLEKVSKDWNTSIHQGLKWVCINHQEAISRGSPTIPLSDYERGLFRMHPAYSRCMAIITSQQPFLELTNKEEKLATWEDQAAVKEKRLKAWENQAFALFSQEVLGDYLCTVLESEGLFKANPNLQKHVATLILKPNRTPEEEDLLLNALQEEQKLGKQENPVFLTKNYQILKYQALKEAEKAIPKEAQSSLFCEKIINDLKAPEVFSENPPQASPGVDAGPSPGSPSEASPGSSQDIKENFRIQKNFNIENFEQGSSKNRFSKNDAVHEYIHLRSISHSNGLSVETMIIHLKQEQLLNKTNHFHEITQNADTPWTSLLIQLGASKRDLQAILRSNNDNISQNLLSKIVLRN